MSDRYLNDIHKAITNEYGIAATYEDELGGGAQAIVKTTPKGRFDIVLNEEGVGVYENDPTDPHTWESGPAWMEMDEVAPNGIDTDIIEAAAAFAHMVAVYTLTEDGETMAAGLLEYLYDEEPDGPYIPIDSIADDFGEPEDIHERDLQVLLENGYADIANGRIGGVPAYSITKKGGGSLPRMGADPRFIH